MGQTGWDGLIPDKFDGIPRETHNSSTFHTSKLLQDKTDEELLKSFASLVLTKREDYILEYNNR